MEPARVGCLVEVTGQSKQWEGSGSGVLVDMSHGCVITHATTLMPFLQLNKRTCKSLLTKGFLTESWFSKLKVLLTFDNVINSQKTNLSKLGQYQASLVNVSLNNQRSSSGLTTLLGEVKHVWKVLSFSQTLLKLFPATDGWKFSDDTDGYKHAKKGEEKMKKSLGADHDVVANLLPYFVLIKIHEWNSVKLGMLDLPSCQLHAGEQIVAVGTPFANLSPEVFLNSTSQGIVCKIAGDHHETILSDARCIPGSEGGPILSLDGCLGGFIVAPLCWKSNEWIGLTLAVSASEVLASLQGSLQNTNFTAIDSVNDNGESSGERCIQQVAPVLLESVGVVLVYAHGTWGTGVLINKHHGIILTCSHVVKNNRTVHIRVDRPVREWYQAEVVYATPLAAVFDIAVLKLKEDNLPHDLPHDLTPDSDLVQGQQVYMLGHALFSREYGMDVSIMQGMLSKVTYYDGIPLITQSTCVVLPGASGGPLVTSDGRLVGIMTCNAKDTASGASYPQVNLSIPAITIWPIIQSYISNNAQDASMLKALHVENQTVCRLWALQEASETEHIFKSNL